MKTISSLCTFLCLLVASYADNTQDHQIAQSRPIQLGTSGGNLNDQSDLYCCSGTLGGLVEDRKGILYILSNNHVLGRTNRGRRREPITQPGLVDADCTLSISNTVAILTKRRTIRFSPRANNVADAAIAQILPGQVEPGGSILGVGSPGNEILEPTVGLAVKKSGRTSGVTHGIIAAVDVTILVEYDKVCGVGTRTAQFVHQIRITPGDFGDFSTGGDSGALVVEDVDTCPRAVGLLFAGGDTDTFANPIANVLSKLKVSMVGCSTAPLAKLSATRRVTAESLAACKSAKDAAEADTLKIPGIVGVGIGVHDTDAAQATVEVYSKGDASDLRQKLPVSLRSVPIRFMKTGTIHAL